MKRELGIDPPVTKPAFGFALMLVGAVAALSFALGLSR
jgi:hypothetical protein